MKKNNKLSFRILALTLSLILVFLALVSCSKNEFDEQPSGQNTSDASDNAATDKPTDKSTEGTTDAPADGENKGENENSGENKNENENSGENKNENENENNEPEKPEVMPSFNINGTTTNWVLSDGISEVFSTKSNAANTVVEVNVPVSEAGNYDLKFDASVGFTKKCTIGNKTASISLPKTVFVENEPIPVSYSTSGLSNTDKLPWICITKNINGKDMYVAWTYVQKNAAGTINLREAEGGRQNMDDTLLPYVYLPAGDYKIYFVDENEALTTKAMHLLDEPISIYIMPENSKGTTVKSSGTAHGNASISLPTNTFIKGTSIPITYTAQNLTDRPWLAIGKHIGDADYYSHWTYTDDSPSGTLSFNATNGNSPQDEAAQYKALNPGNYAVYYLYGSNLKDGTHYLEQIGFNITDSRNFSAKIGSKSILSTTDPYAISNVSKTVEVTEDDVEKGYITITFDFSEFEGNTYYYINVANLSMEKK